MEIYQLKTFVAVAREGSIKRASELLHLSQPAVSAHIKALEDTLGVTLFERTPRGMSLTGDGERLLAKAEHALSAHQDLLQEANRIKGQLSGRLRIGASGMAESAVGQLVKLLAQRYPEVEVAVHHGTSSEVLSGIRNGRLDAGYYNEAGAPDGDLVTVEVSRFAICVAVPLAIAAADPPDWKAFAELPWLYPTTSTCCGKTAEQLFRAHGFRPQRILSIDREQITRGLIANGTGIGLLHDATAREAARVGEVRIAYESPDPVRVLFAHQATRAHDPLVIAATSLARA